MPSRPVNDDLRINEKIRIPRVRLIGEDGEQLGLFKTSDAMDIAYDRGLDLVEVAPNSDPPVARIMDYGKFKYEQAMKAKRAKKHQTTIKIKEIKFRPKVDDHDYETKKRHVVRFLESGAKVKITIMFRGREMAHAERGLMILDRLAEDVREIGIRETDPKLEGRNLHMMMAPVKQPEPKAEVIEEHEEAPVTEPDAKPKAETEEEHEEAPVTDADTEPTEVSEDTDEE